MDTYKVRKRTLHNWKAISVVALVIVILGLIYMATLDDSIEVNNIDIAEVMRGNVSVSIVALGTLQEVKAEIITAKVDGRVIRIDARPGMRVKSGSVLLTLQNDKLHDNLRSAKVLYQQAQASNIIDKSQANAEIDAAHFETLKAKTQETFAKKEYDAKYKAFQMGIISRLSIDESLAKLDLIKTETASAENRYRSQVRVGAAKLQAANASDVLARQQLSKIEQDVQSLSVTPSYVGVVGELFVETGASVNAGSPLLRFIDQSAGYYVRLNVPEEAATGVMVGAKVDVELSGVIVKGLISHVYPFAKDGYITIEAALENALGKRLSADSAVSAQIHGDLIHNAVFVKIPQGVKPNSSISVYVYEPVIKRARKRAVIFGELVGRNIIIRSGLNPGEKILLNTPNENSVELKVKVLDND